MENTKTKSIYSLETFVFIAIFGFIFGGLANVMGLPNLMNTIMKTAYALLLDTVFYIMAISVIAGAIGSLFTEFGVVAIINKLLSPLMKPIYGLPGAASLGIMSTFLSDNPAILALADDVSFKRYFKKYQLPALTNLGTSFGMGLIVVTFMLGLKTTDAPSLTKAAMIGLLGSIIGSIISARIMLHFTKKEYGTKTPAYEGDDNSMMVEDTRLIHDGSVPARILNSLIEGGKSGVRLGLEIIPGVLIICTIVMILTNNSNGEYTGAAYEGIGLLPYIGAKFDFILKPLFGFSSAECISVPITALGAAGAAIGLIPSMIAKGIVHANDIAVFTAMCMNFSGYLSTHVAMMEALKFPHLTGKSIMAHTIGGICSGISAHLLFMLFSMF